MTVTTVTAEYPYIKVTIDTRGLQPLARRAVGNIAIVGSKGGFGSAEANVPVQIGSAAEARDMLAKTDGTGAITNGGKDVGPLYRAVLAALLQNPAPTRVYAVPTADTPVEGGAADTTTPDYSAALTAAEALSVQFVCLAGETSATQLAKLKDHVETVSKAGDARMGVAMVDPMLTTSAEHTFASAAQTAYGTLKSDSGRMILVAARVRKGADGEPPVDVAAAATGAIAGYPPESSVLMKQVSGVRIPLAQQFGGSEIKQLAEAYIIPLIDPELIPGEGLYFGSGRTFNTGGSAPLYVDTVRVVDQIDFMLKAGLIGSIGETRIDRLGLQGLRSRIDGILGPLVTSGVIAAYGIDIPLLPILETEEATRSPGQASTLTAARTERVVEVLLSVTYAGSIHFLDIQLALKA
ncbi:MULTISPECIES: hypothetical protein [unclassified Streptomyces]|uniref:hypothetical protein n=1 Tax=unclassified Streptomyces TaxID=2593676 RepID=UPI002033C69B|nr:MULTISPECIES: hypothetical protein [unclassified Streptomyces]MCM2422904.1 hypothetical protein [Streptomyces sp. RKAG293]MCM2424863.1 hypothetical protein [Streptomyces sp. RKAG337]